MDISDAPITLKGVNSLSQRSEPRPESEDEEPEV